MAILLCKNRSIKDIGQFLLNQTAAHLSYCSVSEAVEGAIYPMNLAIFHLLFSWYCPSTQDCIKEECISDSSFQYLLGH